MPLTRRCRVANTDMWTGFIRKGGISDDEMQ